MNEIIAKSEENIDWMTGCTLCDQGLCEFIDNIVKIDEVSINKAIAKAVDIANRKVGIDNYFKLSTLKGKYYRFNPKPEKEKPVTNVTTPGENTKKSDEKISDTADMSADAIKYSNQLSTEFVLISSKITHLMPLIPDLPEKEIKVLTGAIVELNMLTKRVMNILREV